jgi:hypothetical protein
MDGWMEGGREGGREGEYNRMHDIQEGKNKTNLGLRKS